MSEKHKFAAMKIYRIFIFLSLTALLSGCYINSNIMLKTPKDYVFADPDADTVVAEYRIAPNDVVQFRLFANEGYRLIDLSAGTEENGRVLMNRNAMIDYMVDKYGFVRLPILDSVQIAGYTIREAEIYLQELYDTFYVDPYVIVEVLSRRAIIFPGGGSDAKVVSLTNSNTTLIEVLAAAGGINGRGRAERIKIMRKDIEGNRKVYLIDLSTIEGLKRTDMIIQANDYIYVEPVPQIGREILNELQPIVSILSSAVLIYTAIRTLGN